MKQLINRLVSVIWDDICGRRGYDLEELPTDIQAEIKRDWKTLIKQELSDEERKT